MKVPQQDTPRTGIKRKPEACRGQERENTVSHKKSKWRWVSHSTYGNLEAVRQCPQNLEEIPNNTTAVRRKDRIKVFADMKGVKGSAEAIEGRTNQNKTVN